MQPPTRQMFTAERRMLERAGQAVPLVQAPAAIDPESIRAVVSSTVSDMRKELTADIATLFKEMVVAANPEAEAYTQAIAEAEMLKDEKGAFRRQKQEISLVKNEIRSLTYSIEAAKREIANLYQSQGGVNRLEVMTSELDSVVQDTEKATQGIMDITERIDDLAERLGSLSEGSEMIRDIADQISAYSVRMFESCNFQDLMGQRITKVVNTLKMVDDRLSNIISIWGDEDLADMDLEADQTGLDGLDMMINKPRAEIESVSQDEVDSLLSQDDLDDLFD